jgi:hypothetical protein
MTTYTGWWQVPDHLLPATTLGELEFPRTPNGQDPAAWVDTRDWSDRKTSIPLYDARACPPTKATARQLAAAAARSGRQRTCTQCGAHCQRPLTVDPTDRRSLCPACRHLARLRRRQAELAATRPFIAARARELLAWGAGAAVVQVDLHVPPPTAAGRRRPATAARVRAVDLDGGRLVDVLVRLVGPRAHHVPDGAIAPEAAMPAIHRAVAGRRLVMWGIEDLEWLRHAAGIDDTLPHFYQVDSLSQPHLPIPEHTRAVAVQPMATRWRGQVDPHTRTLVACLAPGAPDRLALLLHRIADTPPAPEPPEAEPRAGAAPLGAAVHTATAQELAQRCQPLVRLASVAGDFWNHAHNLLGTLEHLAATDPDAAVLHAQTELLIADYDQAKTAYDHAATSRQAGDAQPAGR